MELQILSIMLKSRESHHLLQTYIDPKLYSKEAQIIFGFINDYYARDDGANHVDRSVLGELMASTLTNKKHVDKFLGIVDEAIVYDTSESNVRQVVLLAKQRELGTALAMAIANGKEHEHLVEEYRDILRHTSLDELLDKGIDMFTMDDMDSLLAQEADGSRKLKVYPLSLGERLGGGIGGSDHVFVYGRPNISKSACILTMAGGFARQGAPGIIFNNEEAISRLYLRQISNMTGLTATDIRANPKRARDLAEQMGFGNIRFISLSPGNLHQIESFVEQYEPRWFVVDQLRNLTVKSENRANQLESAAIGIRNIGKKYDSITISVSQAGDSAEGKSVLGMSDVDNSKTGIPGACDVMLGIGANEQQKAQGIRVLSLPKNKFGDEDEIPVRFNQHLSKYVSF